MLFRTSIYASAALFQGFAPEPSAPALRSLPVDDARCLKLGDSLDAAPQTNLSFDSRRFFESVPLFPLAQTVHTSRLDMHLIGPHSQGKGAARQPEEQQEYREEMGLSLVY